MFERLDYPSVSLDEYSPFMDAAQLAELTGAAGALAGQRVMHLNSTAAGGGVAEILQSMVPFSNALGIPTERIVINPGRPEFFQVTKKIHNLLQGADGCLTPEELAVYFGCIDAVAEAMEAARLTADVWFLHDPQLLPLAQRLRGNGNGKAAWIWICHIDLTAPNASALASLLPLQRDYDRLIFSLPEYVPAGLPASPPVHLAPPAIDPLTAKNRPLSPEQAWDIVAAMGLDRRRPLITQVSRFDLWKDPWGVVDAYRAARRRIPGLQLALLGLSQAADDPEALEVLSTVRQHAGGDPDVHLFYDPSGLPASIDLVVNAFQVASMALLQKSTREGFGLTVTEGMWKGTPMIGGNVGGIRLQIEDGSSGYLVSSPEECAQRIIELAEDDERRARVGQAARESVRRRFLLPRLALDYLKVAAASRGVGVGN